MPPFKAQPPVTIPGARVEFLHNYEPWPHLPPMWTLVPHLRHSTNTLETGLHSQGVSLLFPHLMFLLSKISLHFNNVLAIQRTGFPHFHLHGHQPVTSTCSLQTIKDSSKMAEAKIRILLRDNRKISQFPYHKLVSFYLFKPTNLTRDKSLYHIFETIIKPPTTTSPSTLSPSFFSNFRALLSPHRNGSEPITHFP